MEFVQNIFIKPKVKFNIKKIIKILKLHNLFDNDFFTDNKGKPVLLEVNPRPSGSISQCYKKRFLFCLLLYQIIWALIVQS